MPVHPFDAVTEWSEAKGTARLVLLAIADGRRATRSICEFANADAEEVKKALDVLTSSGELLLTKTGDYLINLP